VAACSVYVYSEQCETAVSIELRKAVLITPVPPLGAAFA
jgi:hypothetical protein